MNEEISANSAADDFHIEFVHDRARRGRAWRLPHLAKAIALNSQNGMGLCFLRAAALVLDLPGSTMVLGTFRAATPDEQKITPEASATPFIHAWVEHEGLVLPPTMIERFGGTLMYCDWLAYYTINGVRDVRRLDRDTVLEIARRTGLSTALMRGKHVPARVTSEFVDAAGVTYRVAADGAVLPA